MLISDLVGARRRGDVVAVAPEANLLAMAETLKRNNVGALLVTEGRALLGIVSERDLVRAFAAHGGEIGQCTVGEVMTHDVIACTPGDDVMATLERMSAKHIRHIPVLEDGQPVAMLSLREFEHACKRLQAEAVTDALTGLANRRGFLHRLDEELARHQRYRAPMTLAMLDVDHFKRVNDDHGHEVGNAVLRTLGQLLTREVRGLDAIGRLGGEEFGIMFVHTSLDDARRAADRLLAAVRAEVVAAGTGAIRFTISIGLTELAASDMSTAPVLKRADELLYRAKREGRDRVVCAAVEDALPAQPDRPAEARSTSASGAEPAAESEAGASGRAA